MMTGRELEQLRKSKQLSREQLARALETSAVTVWRWETGESNISPVTEKAIYSVLKD